MKVVVVSDTHGRNEALWEVIEREAPFDKLIHCGDFGCEPDIIRNKVDCAMLMVAGNCDYYGQAPRENVFPIGNYKALLVHGHVYDVYSGMNSLYYSAKQKQVDIVFYGHTHVPMIDTSDDISFINPGSLTYPRQIGRRRSYIVMTIEGDDKPQYELKYLDEE